MNRKLTGCGILLPLMGTAAFSLISCTEKEEKTVTPNIIILYTDDMGYGDISYNNPKSRIQTPNLDRLAAGGICFTDGHSSATVSSPSRYSILTGNYHWREVRKVAANFTRPLFDKDQLTVADVLKSKGYFTACVGKWHLGWDWDSVLKPGAKLTKHGWGDYYELDMIDWNRPLKGGPCEYGFDYYYGNDCPFHPPYAMIENERFLEKPQAIHFHGDVKAKEGDSEMRNGPKAKDWNPYDLFPALTRKVVDLIRNSSEEKPFFIYYGIPAPHSPIIPNDEFDGKSGAGPYGDYIVETDHYVGQIMSALKEKGIDRNTIVIFTSDNGPEVYAPARLLKYGHNSTNLRGIKRDVYEGGHRVPFIVSWPDRIKPGQISDEVISQVDLMATCASLVGYELPDDKAVDSYDLLPLWTGKKYKSPLREATVAANVGKIFAVRHGDWLLINGYSGRMNGDMKRYPGYDEYFDPIKYDRDNPGLLFNMRQDVMQRENLYAQHPEIVEKISAILERYKSSGRSVPHRTSNN